MTSLQDAKLNTPVPMMRYILQLGGLIVLLTVVVIVAAMVLKFTVPSAMGIITLMAALAAVTQSFVRREGRALLGSERVTLAFGAVLLTLIIGAATILAIALASDVPLTTAGLGMAFFGDAAMPWWVFPVGFAVSAIVAWLVTYFAAGFMSRSAKKAIDKQAAKTM